jgi:ArsR family transcriptional regulator, arsenate/arsenite/antimonite-responsive transcriptional repressor
MLMWRVDLDRVFDALASPARRGVLAALAQREATTTELALRFAMSTPAMSRHLSVLENAGLVASRRERQRVLYSPVRDTLIDALGVFTAALTPAAAPRTPREPI